MLNNINKIIWEDNFLINFKALFSLYLYLPSKYPIKIQTIIDKEDRNK